MRQNRAIVSSCLALAAALFGSTAVAQEDGLAVDRLVPSSAGDRMFGVDSPYVAGKADVHVRLQGDYASNSLSLFKKNGRAESFAVVGDQAFLRLNGSLSLWNRLNINLDVPIAVAQGGDSPTLDGQTFQSPDGAAFGDLRAGLRLRLLGELRDPLQLAIGGYVWFPTGKTGADSFVTDGSLRALPQAIVGGEFDWAVWSFNVGADIRESQEYAGVAQGTMLRWGGGLGVLVGAEKQVQIGPEFSAAVTLDDVRRKNTNAEILLGAKYRFIPELEAGLAAGPGITPGYGTPDARLVATLGYTPSTYRPRPDRDGDGFDDRVDACPDVAAPAGYTDGKGCPPPSDRDRDGIIDSADKCPDLMGVASEDPMRNGCPSDRDGDGLVDEDDACPDEAAPADANAERPGCLAPPDTDGDGVADGDDACPSVPGVQSAVASDRGCPPDTDGDSVRDDVDACPAEKGAKDADPKKNGCPTSVRVSDGEIIILQQVQFATGTSNILPESDALLAEVADVLRQHPEIASLEVQGHTDDRGAKALNTRLSQDRAEAVRAVIVDSGIDGARLEAKGYGSAIPIADNATDEGRGKNRRVQFKILKRDSK